MGKYDEALDRAKKAVKEGMVSQSFVDDIFGVQESEDERIRKAILALVKKHAVNHERCQMEAYLEKQKEVDYLGTKISFPAAYSVVSDAGYVIISEKEYKEHLEGIRIFAYSAGVVDTKKKYEKEQEPACAGWSEEDERMMLDVIQFIETGWTDNGKSHLIPWLKSLHERCNLQQKQEWSEKDEKIRQSIIKDIEFERNFTSATTGKVIGKYNEQIAWLKSLHPQPHWKPSEEQMEWLESAVKLSTDKPRIHGIIISLYEQLKRLL